MNLYKLADLELDAVQDRRADLLAGDEHDRYWVVSHRLVDRFGPYWRILLAHVIMFGFVFPSARSKVPEWVLQDLLQRLQGEGTADADDPACYGTLLSWSQYLGDVLGGSFRDARIRPFGTMSAEEVARWTSADKG